MKVITISKKKKLVFNPKSVIKKNTLWSLKTFFLRDLVEQNNTNELQNVSKRVEPNETFCELCKIYVKRNFVDEHQKTKLHLRIKDEP